MKILSLLLILGVLYLAYEVARVGYYAYVSKGLVALAEGFERAEGSRSLLVLGDSTAVGVGVHDAHNTVAGRLSQALNASVENHAVSGEVTADTAAQLAAAQKDSYDLVLIQIGANDVIGFRDLGVAQADLKRLLDEARTKSDRIVLLTAGKIGEAPLFPWFARALMTERAADLRERFSSTAAAFGVVYVDLFAIPDPFATDPRRYYAPDGLHLTDDGYGFWYEQVKHAIEARWPDLYE